MHNGHPGISRVQLDISTYIVKCEEKEEETIKKMFWPPSLFVCSWVSFSLCVLCLSNATAWGSPPTTWFLTWYQSLTTERGWFWRLKWRRRSKDSSKQATGKKLSHFRLFLLDSTRWHTPIGLAVVIFAIWGCFGPRFRPAKLRTTVSGYATISVVLTRTVCTGYRFQILSSEVFFTKQTQDRKSVV